jgi:hypothetical protein
MNPSPRSRGGYATESAPDPLDQVKVLTVLVPGGAKDGTTEQDRAKDEDDIEAVRTS